MGQVDVTEMLLRQQIIWYVHLSGKGGYFIACILSFIRYARCVCLHVFLIFHAGHIIRKHYFLFKSIFSFFWRSMLFPITGSSRSDKITRGHAKKKCCWTKQQYKRIMWGGWRNENSNLINTASLLNPIYSLNTQHNSNHNITKVGKKLLNSFFSLSLILSLYTLAQINV